jgi:hypothetical protein
MCGYAAAYVHSFFILYCVERHVDMILTRIKSSLMMISWWSKHVGVILSVLMCDIWINTNKCISWTITHSELKCTVKHWNSRKSVQWEQRHSMPERIDRQTDRHDWTNSRFCQFCERAVWNKSFNMKCKYVLCEIIKNNRNLCWVQHWLTAFHVVKFWDMLVSYYTHTYMADLVLFKFYKYFCTTFYRSEKAPYVWIKITLIR